MDNHFKINKNVKYFIINKNKTIKENINILAKKYSLPNNVKIAIEKIANESFIKGAKSMKDK